ncbi:hypothetical protein [Proteiniphilum sp. UBA1028]|jgi:hypothetical protein|uniref:hypothetical protein n=1 Tax=Proteiniphilum sp. UBA1028 TaxID=1947251 RepID=UPI000E7FF2C2|nr:hypothetical protein [Proteiniphilum sp. UBA1028]HBG56737.1 hypothetical protein [Porphyromonadaceae bacterium]
MNIRKKRFFLLIALLSITVVTFAQQVGSNSPYSRYGYGLLSNPSLGASEAMGGISYGLRRSQQVNPGNPASYSELDSLTFIFDFGVSGHLARMNDGINNRDFYNGNLDYIAIQFPLIRNVGASIGLLPFSKTGYNFGGARALSNIQYVETYRGTGGLTQIYGGIAWEPFKNISLGANVNYLFGSFSHSSVVTPVSTSALIGETKYTYAFRELKYDVGIQYTYPIDKIRSLTFGAVYTPQINARADVNPTEMLYTGDPYENPWLSPSQVLITDTLKEASFQLPHTFGAGFTYSNGKLLIGMDGTYQLWKNLDYPAVLDDLTVESRFNNAYRLNAGLEYVINPLSQNFFHRIRFRGGLSFANSYANFSVTPPDGDASEAVMGSFREYGVNIGVGLPFHDYMSGRISMLNIGLGYSRQQPNRDFMISQDMFKVSINVNINELWFFKRQFN